MFIASVLQQGTIGLATFCLLFKRKRKEQIYFEETASQEPQKQLLFKAKCQIRETFSKNKNDKQIDGSDGTLNSRLH